MLCLRKLFFSLASFFVIGGLVIALAPRAQAATSAEPYSIIMLSGQSNAEGTGTSRSSISPALGTHPADDNTQIYWSVGIGVCDGTGDSSTLQTLTNDT